MLDILQFAVTDCVYYQLVARHWFGYVPYPALSLGVSELVCGASAPIGLVSQPTIL